MTDENRVFVFTCAAIDTKSTVPFHFIGANVFTSIEGAKTYAHAWAARRRLTSLIDWQADPESDWHLYAEEANGSYIVHMQIKPTIIDPTPLA